MSNVTMRSRVDQIHDEQQKLYNELEAIQIKCSHPEEARVSKNKSDTGNYDLMADSYWTEHHCTLCDKQWHENH